MAEEEDERFGLLKPGEAEPWRVLEFYSGIGGMRYSTIKAGVNARVVEAFDINDKANDVYQHNFYHRPFQGNIESLTAADLDRYGAHAWLLSPPCQPYTRQGLQKGSEDARASSFLVILELIPHIKEPPFLLFVENVVGFEASDTHRKMIELLIKADYVTQEFILSPLQFNIPYSRPRYFCLAKRKPLSFRCPQISHQLCCSPGPLIDENGRSDESSEESLSCCEQIWRYLEFQDGSSTTRTESDFLPTNSTLISDSVMLPKSEEESGSSLEMYYVPLSLVERWGSAMDIVYPDSTRCCCFTKSYYRYVKGTGSLLAAVQPEVKGKASSLKTQKLRYFTPREVANLHSFPEDFQFPQHISLRQRYALLGNSLSVAVVASLLKYLFASPP